MPDTDRPGLALIGCGSRTWTRITPVRGRLDRLARRYHLVAAAHGAARGADLAFADAWHDITGQTPEAFPADWAQHGRSAGPIRNRQMLDWLTSHQPDLRVGVLAFKDDYGGLGARGGTEHMTTIAAAAGVPVLVIGNGTSWRYPANGQPATAGH